MSPEGEVPFGAIGHDPFLRRRDLIASVQLLVAADESGVHGKPSYCLIAGYIASAREWARFERRWAELLRDAGVPAFHAKRFFARDHSGARVDNYREWQDDRALWFLNEILFCIDQHRITPLVGAVHVPSFTALTYGERKYLTGGMFTDDHRWLSTGAPSQPYFLAMQHLIVEALAQAKGPFKVHFVLDRQNVMEARAVQTFTDIVRLTHPRAPKLQHLSGGEKLGRIAFGAAPEEPSLQAADLLTYSWYGFLTRGQEGLNRERTYAMERLSRKRDFVRMHDAQGLELVLSKLPLDIRAALRNEPDPTGPR